MNRFLKVLVVTLLMVTQMVIISTSEIHVSAASIFFVVTNGNDSSDCLSPTTACATLAGALAKAASGDTIQVATGTYTGTGEEVILVNKNITLSGGWNDTFTIRTGLSTIDGQNARQVMDIPGVSTVSVEYFIIQNGFYNNGEAGGIANHGLLTLDHCIIQNNQGSGWGGGITNYGTLSIRWSTIKNNQGASVGGGIYSWQYGGPLEIVSSVINDNTAGEGAGIYLIVQDLSINNSTISGNTASSNGGGIYVHGGTGHNYSFNNVTITENEGGGYAGGGIYFSNVYGGSFVFKNSILANNTANIAPDCYGSIGSAGFNIIGDTTNCSFSSTTGDQLNVNPKLGVLQDNGGPTFTHWLYADSPAIDGGNPSGCTEQDGNPLTTDQRGFARSLDGDNDGNNICDIGAYEADPSNLPPPPVNSLWYVTPTGNDANDCHSPDTACATINGAIGKAISGDWVYVSTGVFTAIVGNEVVLIDKDLSLSGGWDMSFTSQGDLSTIDGQYVRGGITVNKEVKTTIEHFNIRNGESPINGSFIRGGGGVYIASRAKVTLSDSIVQANNAGNDAPWNPLNANGGGISLGSYCNLTINDSLIIGNTAYGAGGGIYTGNSTVILNDSTVSNNIGLEGGGMAGFNGGRIELYNSRVIYNTSTTPMDDGGGGINSFFATLILKDSVVAGNTAASEGGGIVGHWMTIEDSIISGNRGSTGGGISNWSDVTIRNSAILNNTATQGGGGGIISQGNLVIINTTVAYNTAENPSYYEAYGGGILRYTGNIQASNVTIARNVAEDFGGGIYSENLPITLQNTLLAGNQANTAPDCGGNINSAGYNLIGDTSGCSFIPAAGDLTNIDPRIAFQYGWPGTLALWVDSPAIDGGNPSGCTDEQGNPITVDQIGTIRPLDGDGDSNIICDVGAYEYDPAHPPHWTFLPLITR